PEPRPGTARAQQNAPARPPRAPRRSAATRQSHVRRGAAPPPCVARTPSHAPCTPTSTRSHTRATASTRGHIAASAPPRHRAPPAAPQCHGASDRPSPTPPRARVATRPLPSSAPPTRTLHHSHGAAYSTFIAFPDLY